MNETQAVKALRKLRTELRRTRSTAIIHSGGRQTIYGCVCGATHTCATSYRRARHVATWREEHAQCAYRAWRKAMGLWDRSGLELPRAGVSRLIWEIADYTDHGPTREARLAIARQLRKLPFTTRSALVMATHRVFGA